MKAQELRRKLKKTHINDVFRYILAITLIFSGFVKTIDPWGTALMLEEYLTVFGWEGLKPAAMVFGIWLCAAELMMGCMLFCAVRLRLITLFCVLSMTIFTGLTLWLAITEPIEDCGCFGNALKMTNWESFAKNAVLWPMSIVLWWAEKDRRFFPFTLREGVLTVVFACSSGLLGIYCYRHLPLIDFLPFKKGVNIVEEMQRVPEIEDIKTTLIYRDLESGKLHEFELTDTTWYDTTRWEYVDTKIEGEGGNTIDISVRDFAVFDASGDVTEEILSMEGTTRLVCVLNLDELESNPKAMQRLVKMVREAEMLGDNLVCVTASLLPSSPSYIAIGGLEVRCYNMDATTLKAMLRAKVGSVTLQEGTIVDKRTMYDF